MKYVIIAFCILLVILAFYIIIKTIRSYLSGKCCSGCDGCKLKGQCSKEEKPK